MYRHGHKKPVWERQRTNPLFEHRRITLVEDDVILPGGQAIGYLRFGRTSEAALVVLTREDGRILLETEYSYPSDRILYQFPCGVSPVSEDPADAALRELREEAKLSARLEPIGSYLMYHRRTDARMYVFAGFDAQPDDSGQPDVTEDIRLHWLLPAEIDELIIAGEIPNVDVLAPWLLYKLKVLNR